MEINKTIIAGAAAIALSLATMAGAAHAEGLTQDWHTNPAAYAPDDLGDYGLDTVKVVAETRAVKKVVRLAAVETPKTPAVSGYDWHANAADYAPDGLSDYGDQPRVVSRNLDLVQKASKSAPNA